MATPRLGLVVEGKPTELSCIQLCFCIVEVNIVQMKTAI